MALRNTSGGLIGLPDNEPELQQFRRHCHQLLAVGYNRLRADDHSESEEDKITEELVAETKRFLRREFGPIPRWATRYSLNDQIPIHIPGVPSANRPKIDIEFESLRIARRPIFHFEAKRLREDDTHSVSAYVGPNGLGCFTSERYGRSETQGGMLGYVQSREPAEWSERIATKLMADPDEYRLTNAGQWQAEEIVRPLAAARITMHSRPQLGCIAIYHTMLDFRAA